ncbi:MAG TPA: sigma-70 family RNA polymerase sigma factor [Ktedonobacterales bacterium]
MQNHPPVATDPPTTDSDRHLLARVRLRDSAAFEQLFGRYYAPLRQALGRMLGDDDQADDLTQETFLALYTHPPQLQNDEEALRCWLYRVALNRGYNTLRTRRRDAARLPDLYRPDATLDPEAEAVRREERERVQLALATLPERQAKLLVLRQQEGLKYAELAAILEVAPSSIGTLLVRAERAFQLAWNQHSTARPTPNTKGEYQP